MKIITKEGEVQALSIWNFPDVTPPAMTSLQGDMDVSYKDIVNVFGKETLKGDDYKIQAEWHVITPDGFATIYDYKQGVKYNGRHDGIPKSKVRDWHIGGNTVEVVKWIYKALNLK